LDDVLYDKTKTTTINEEELKKAYDSFNAMDQLETENQKPGIDFFLKHANKDVTPDNVQIGDELEGIVF